MPVYSLFSQFSRGRPGAAPLLVAQGAGGEKKTGDRAGLRVRVAREYLSPIIARPCGWPGEPKTAAQRVLPRSAAARMFSSARPGRSHGGHRQPGPPEGTVGRLPEWLRTRPGRRRAIPVGERAWVRSQLVLAVRDSAASPRAATPQALPRRVRRASASRWSRPVCRTRGPSRRASFRRARRLGASRAQSAPGASGRRPAPITSSTTEPQSAPLGAPGERSRRSEQVNGAARAAQSGAAPRLDGTQGGQTLPRRRCHVPARGGGIEQARSSATRPPASARPSGPVVACGADWAGPARPSTGL